MAPGFVCFFKAISLNKKGVLVVLVFFWLFFLNKKGANIYIYISLKLYWSCGLEGFLKKMVFVFCFF